MTAPAVTLPGGDALPLVGQGTYKLEGDAVRDPVAAALDAGYEHVDTAEGHMNEAALGDALAASDAHRDDVFLTPKVLPENLAYESVLQACERTLDALGTDSLDLYLIHWPNPAISMRETLDAIATLDDRGLVRNVGVSNFSTYQLGVACHVSDVPIAVYQIEHHPWLQRPDLVECCREHDVAVEAAAPLARGQPLDDDALVDVANKHGKTPAQVVLRWAVEDDVVVLPKSSFPAHVRENHDVFDFELDPAYRERIDAMDRDHAVYDDRKRDWTRDTFGIAKQAPGAGTRGRCDRPAVESVSEVDSVRERHAEVPLHGLLVRAQFLGRGLVHDLPVREDVHAVGEVERDANVLFDEQHGDAGVADVLDDLHDAVDDERCKPLGRFVEHEEVGAGDERASDREHLLFATREVAPAVLAALVEVLERIEHPLQVPAVLRVRAPVAREFEVLGDGEPREDAALLGDEPDAALGGLDVAEVGDVHAAVRHRARPRFDRPEDGAERRRLPDAVPADERDDLALVDGRVHALEDARLAVPRLEVVEFEHRRHA
jgi:diketogulonate reductase-like aldo/keto reductase